MYIDTTVPQIDLANAPTCLACPLAECVYMFEDDAEFRRLCPIGRAEMERNREHQRRWREKKRRAGVNLTDERNLV